MNTSIKSKHFSKWLNRKIGSKNSFRDRFDRSKVDLNRWSLGQNFPKLPVFSQLIYELHLHTNQEYTSILTEAMAELQKDYREWEFEQKKIRGDTNKKTDTD